MKKILIVTPYCYPEGGGLENYAHQIAKRLQDAGHRVVVLGLTKNNSSQETVETVTVIRKKADFIISNTPVKFSFYYDIVKVIKQYNIDVVHAHAPVPFAADMAALACRAKKIPLLLTYHANTLFKGKLLTDLIALFYLPIQRLTFNSAKKIIFVFGNIGAKYKKWRHKIQTIPPGVDLKKFSNTPYPANTRHILFISPLSRAYPSKGVNILLQALRRLKSQINDFKAYVAGTGDLEEHYKKYVLSNNLEKHVVFWGKLKHQDMPALYQQSNILVVPSLKSEGSPTVITEAMACGRPVIGTRVGGIPELIENNYNGIVIEPNNAEVLYEKIKVLLTSTELASSMGQHGRTIAEQKYSWDIIAKKYEQLIQNIQ